MNYADLAILKFILVRYNYHKIIITTQFIKRDKRGK